MRGTILMLCVAALAGCEESTMVGSGCPNGACPEALVRDDDMCTVRTDYASLMLSGEPISDTRLCLDSPLERSGDGTAPVRVYFKPINGEEAELDCTEHAFLKPVAASVHAMLTDDNEPDVAVCEVVQLPVVAGEDGGAPTVGAGEGFYYDDFSDPAAARCNDGGAQVVLTPGARPWQGVMAQLAAGEVRNSAGELDSSLSCLPLQGTEPVGTACAPTQTEYFDSQVIIATHSDDCGQGVCMAYHLEGQITSECDEPVGPDGSVSDLECVSPRERAQRMYCTCRCDGPPGATDLCTCPDQFVCIEIDSPIVPSVAGGYCVRQFPIDWPAD